MIKLLILLHQGQLLKMAKVQMPLREDSLPGMTQAAPTPGIRTEILIRLGMVKILEWAQWMEKVKDQKDSKENLTKVELLTIPTRYTLITFV
jgi:hypothetical protein